MSKRMSQDNKDMTNKQKVCIVECDFCGNQFKVPLKRLKQMDGPFDCQWDGGGDIKCMALTLINEAGSILKSGTLTERMAYLAGYAAVSGVFSTDGMCLTIYSKGPESLYRINDMFGKMFKVKMVTDYTECCEHEHHEMKIGIVQMAQVVKKYRDFDNLDDDASRWAYIRGNYDACGVVESSGPDITVKFTNTKISTEDSKRSTRAMFDFIGVPGEYGECGFSYTGNNALDFVGKMYNMLEHCSTTDHKYTKFRGVLDSNGPCDTFYFTKTLEDAVVPSKPRMSDNGFDLTIVKKIKTVGDVEFYDTGIAVSPPMGYWSMVVPRSSISKTGYMMANGVGIIDSQYRGSLIIALRKVNHNVVDLTLPCRIAQLIPQRAFYPQMVQVDSLDDTGRGTGGFGSSGN